MKKGARLARMKYNPDFCPSCTNFLSSICAKCVEGTSFHMFYRHNKEVICVYRLDTSYGYPYYTTDINGQRKTLFLSSEIVFLTPLEVLVEECGNG